MAGYAEQLQDFQWFAERFFCIRDKAARVVPFKMNDLQKELLPNLCGADDVLKARKGGVSTLIVLKELHRCLTRQNQRALILAHEHRSAIELFEIARVAYDHLPDGLKPRLEIDNRQEMKFQGLGSRITSHTAKNLDLGRGGTIDMLHCSEIAFWDNPERTLTAVEASMGSHPEIYRESTANGAGTYWHREWLRSKQGVSGFRPHFFPWWIERSYKFEEPDLVRDPDEFDDRGQPRWKVDPNAEFQFSEREQQLGLTPQQARWRRRMVRRFGTRFAQEYAEDDLSCFLTSGNCFFDAQRLKAILEVLGTWEGLVLETVPQLGLEVYHKFKPEEFIQCEFVIGADTSEGLVDEVDPRQHGDYSAASVLERRTGLQVAAVHGSWEPYEFAKVLAEVAARYTTINGAPLLGVEANEYGHAVLNELRYHLNYPNLYMRPTSDPLLGTTSRRAGWRTDAQTRGVMLSDLAKALAPDGWLKVRDPSFIAECLTFTRNRHGRPEAQSGCHDDRVVAVAIAAQMLQYAAGNAMLVGTNFD